MSSRKKKALLLLQKPPTLCCGHILWIKKGSEQKCSRSLLPQCRSASWQAAGANHKSCIGYKSKTADTLTLWVIYLKYNSQNQKSMYVPWLWVGQISFDDLLLVLHIRLHQYLSTFSSCSGLWWHWWHKA